MVTVKTSAIAHPVQELIKRRGNGYDDVRLPFKDFISVCMAPLKVHTTVEFGDFDEDTLSLDSPEIEAGERERIFELMNTARLKTECSSRFRIVAMCNFPRNVGIGTLDPLLASLALAASRALDLSCATDEVSKLATRGSLSSTASVLGGFSRTTMGLGAEDSRSRPIRSDKLQMGILVSVLPHSQPARALREGQAQTPVRASRVPEASRLVEEMELAIRQGDVGRVCHLSESDTLLLHGVSMTGLGEELYWPLETLRVIRAVKRMRDEEIPAFFSIGDMNAIYVNTFLERSEDVSKKLQESGVVYWKCHVGNGVREVDDHLF